MQAIDQVLSNAHCHTTWCDGQNSPEEMIQAAIRLGFVSLGFSVHGWTPYEPCPITLEREELYRQELRSLRAKYGDQIEILIGAERDSGYQRDFSAFEYVIDSTHVIEKDGEFMFVDWSAEKTEDYIHRHFADDPYAYARAYYDREAELCARADGLFIGHIDLLTKFNQDGRFFDETDPRYLKPAMQAIEIAVRRGLPLEMNTGAISRGYRTTPYPAPHLLKAIHDLGGEIIINSDAHSAAGLNTGFDICLAQARAAGFDHILYLRKTGLQEVGI